MAALMCSHQGEPPGLGPIHPERHNHVEGERTWSRGNVLLGEVLAGHGRSMMSDVGTCLE